jgi:perosamine synthetase
MLKRIPIVGCPISLRNLSFGFLSLFRRTYQTELSNAISLLLNSKYVCFTDSGTSSFYTFLKILKDGQNKKEVILPAYTASSLIIAIQKAGLRPVLCDISLDDFNMDANLLSDLVSKDTLCILCVHMFGIVNKGLRGLKRRFSDVFVVEDCAQSLGSKIDAMFAGNSADASIFSFNRGKNLPTYGGGCIATNSQRISERIIEENKRIKGLAMGQSILIPFKILGLSLAARPLIYGLGYPFISQFKDVAPPRNFEVKKYADFQAAVALSLLRRIEEFSKKRYMNGLRLIEGLRNVEDIVLPQISKNTQPAFNRLPIVFRDVTKGQKAEEALDRAGVDTSRMYLRPIHHIFDLGYVKEDFPTANYLAERLLTLPAHPSLTDAQLNRIIRTIKNA